MRLLAKQPIVVGMATDPKPDETIRRFDCQRAVVRANPCRPELADLLEVKRWVPRLLFQTRVRAVCEIAYVGRQQLIQRPEIRRGVMIQSGVVLPAA
jgi:hypothetical protein